MTIARKGIKDWFINAFPAPTLMTMPAVALDISPNSVKYLDGTYTAKGCLPKDFKEVFLPSGTIIDGRVEDHGALVSALKELKEESGKKFAFVAIPENALYLYTLQLSGRLSDRAILQQIEFSFKEHVPLPIEEAVYDFDIVGITRNGTIVSVTAAPKVVIGAYEAALSEAGFIVRSIELEAYAVARSASSMAHSGVEMVVDIGYNRAGIIITKHGSPIFSVTISGGSQSLDSVLDECKKQYTFWDTRTNTKGKRIERISHILATGGGASIEFIERLGEKIGAKVQVVDIWQNLFSVNDYIPEIDAADAQAMATLAGLLAKNKE